MNAGVPQAAAAGRRGAVAVGALLAALAALRLATAYPAVPNRFSFGWDPARRAILNLEAADALRHGRALDFGWYLAGPETWPTLRMALVAPLLAVTGPSFAVESGVTGAIFALVAVAVALAAAPLARGSGRSGAALVAAAAGLATLANHAAVSYAVTGMLEPLAALGTALSAAAWLELRERGEDAPLWPLALAAQVAFHAKWQHGILVALAVLLVEGAERRADLARAWPAVAAALRRAAARPLAWLLAAAVAVLGALALAVAATGGFEVALLGARASVHSPDGPLFWCAFIAFYGLVFGAWRARGALAAIPRRLRRLALGLALPMGVWILVPFTWRVRTLLVTAGAYDSGEAVPAGPLGGVAYYARALAEGFAPAALAALGFATALTAIAAARRPELRRRLVPLAALIGVELAALGLGTRKNFQARFTHNLVPIVALLAVAGLPFAARAVRALAAPAVAVALAAAAASIWGRALPQHLSRGFGPPEVPESCLAVARALPFGDAVLIASTDGVYRHDCRLAFLMEAQRRGVRLTVDAAAPRPRDREAVLVALDGAEAPAALADFAPDGPLATAGRLSAQRYRRAAPSNPM